MNDRQTEGYSLQPAAAPDNPDAPRYWRQAEASGEPGMVNPRHIFPDGAARADAAGWCPDLASILTKPMEGISMVSMARRAVK